MTKQTGWRSYIPYLLWRHIPGKYVDNHLVFTQFTVGDLLLRNFQEVRRRTPLGSFFSIWWWRGFIKDYQNGFVTCGCGRTYWDYRLKPAIFGDWKWHGGGC
jgi:hypothetical protein